jgi:hypothetical protein
MRPRSAESSGRDEDAGPAGKAIAAVLALPIIGFGVAGSSSYSAAQGTAADVAHVEAVSGRVVAAAGGKPALLDVLDTLGDQTRLDLLANSELRICHYQTRKLITLRGPLRVAVSASNVTVENGKAAGASTETCAAPLVSTFQGGIVSRNIAAAATTTLVPLRPSIKVVNRGSRTIRKIALWDGSRQARLATFEHSVARPILDNAKSYLLVVELSDGSELTMILQANEATRTGPVFLVVR